MRTRPVLASAAALALLGTAVVPALAAAGDPADRPAAGSATSSLTLLDVGLGGRSLSVLQLALRSETLTGAPTTSFVVTPLTSDGTAYGRQTVTSRSAVLPAVDSTSSAPVGLSAVATARSPRIDVLSDGGTSRAGTASLGDLSVLGLPLGVDGTADISSVVDGVGASGGKTLRLTNLALPSLADLIAALGLDLAAVPPASLTDVVNRLDLDSTSIRQAQALLDQALAPVQPQVHAAESLVAETDDAVEAADAVLTGAQAELAAAVATLNDATRALTGTITGARVGQLVARRSLAVPLTETIDTVLSPSPSPLTGTIDAVLSPSPSPSPLTDTVDAVLSPSPSPSPLTDVIEDTVDTVVSPSPLASTIETVLSPSPTPLTDTVDSTLDTVTAPLQPVVDDTTRTVEEVLPLPELVITPELQPLLDAYDAAKTAYDAALAAVATAEAALATATTVLADAVGALQTLLAPYAAQVDAVVGAVIGVLDATPLVSLDRLEVSTRSAVTSATPGGQRAEVVGGEVSGLRVLGTDVLATTLGSSQVDVLDVAGPAKARLAAAVAGLTGALSAVLSDVPGLPGLEVPAPKVELLKRATATDVVDGFGVAGSALRALTVTWPGITIPAAAALPGASTLPSVVGIPTLPTTGLLRTSAISAAGDVLTQPLTLSLATLQDRASFRPAQLSAAPGTTAPGTTTPGATAPATTTPGTTTPGATPGTGTPGTPVPGTGTPGTGTAGTGTPGTGSPRTTPVGLTQLPRTGGTPGALALLLVGVGLVLHRRYRTV